jgi:hypothetical protein
MADIGRPTDALSLANKFPGVCFVNCHHGDEVIVGAAKRELFSDFDARRVVHGKRDGHGEQSPVLQAHLFEDALIVGLAHETVERRERAGREKLEVTQGTRRELDRR